MPGFAVLERDTPFIIGVTDIERVAAWRCWKNIADEFFVCIGLEPALSIGALKKLNSSNLELLVSLFEDL